MKTLLTLTLSFASVAYAQSPPSLVGLMSSSDGVNWSNIETTSNVGAFPPSFTPSKVGILCYNSGTGQWSPTGCPPGGGGGDTITSPNGSIVIGGTSTATTIDLNLNQTLQSVTFNTAGQGISYPNGSEIVEDLVGAGSGLFVVGANTISLETLGGQGFNLKSGDGTNNINVGQLTGGGVLQTVLEALTNNSVAFFSSNRQTNTFNAANVTEAQIGSAAVTGGGTVIGAFAPVLAVGDHTIAMKGGVAYVPLNPASPGASVALTTDSYQSYTLTANTTATAPTIYVGEHLLVQICQPAVGGPFTWTWPAAIVGGQPPFTAASTCTQQTFDSTNGTQLVAENNNAAYVNVANTFSALQTFTAREINSTNGALSTPAMLYSGSPIATGGTGTTTFPMFLMQPTGATAVTTWATAGTFFGINTASGFVGDIFSFAINGSVQLHLSAGGTLAGSSSNFTRYQTSTNCSSSASPAVCAASSSGSVAVPAGTNPTLVVNTTALSANSQVLLTEDQSLGTKLGVTCNTTLPTGASNVTARVAGTSFTIEVTGVFTTNPVCVSYAIIN